LEGPSAPRNNAIKDYVSIHEGLNKEKLTAFIRVLSSLGFTETPSKSPLGAACGVTPATRVIVTMAGYAIIIIIWIIGISQDWGLLFNLEFCLAPMIWMMITLVTGILVFKREVTYSLDG